MDESILAEKLRKIEALHAGAATPGERDYRYKRQRKTTVMARVPRAFVEVTLWPEFQELSRTLQEHLSEVTDRMVSEVLVRTSSDERNNDAMAAPQQIDPRHPHYGF